jgi:hypothetical protein
LSRIPDSTTATKEAGQKNFLSHLLKIIFLNRSANLLGIIVLFTQKSVIKLIKIWVWDPGSEIRDREFGKNLIRIHNPGVKKTPGPGSATLHFNIQKAQGKSFKTFQA